MSDKDIFSCFAPPGVSLFSIEISAMVHPMWVSGHCMLAGEKKALAPQSVHFSLVNAENASRRLYLVYEATKPTETSYDEYMASVTPKLDLFSLAKRVEPAVLLQVFESLAQFGEMLTGALGDPTGRKVSASLGRLRAVHQLEERIVHATFFSRQDVIDLQFEQSHQCRVFLEFPCTRDLYGRLREHYKGLLEAGRTVMTFDSYYATYVQSQLLMEPNTQCQQLNTECAKPMRRDLRAWFDEVTDPQQLVDRLMAKYPIHEFHRQVIEELVLDYLHRKAMGEEPAEVPTNFGAATMELFL